MTDQELTYGELFAGYGGLGMGVQSVLGGRIAWCAEFEQAPSRILAHHWPDVPNYGDVTKIKWAPDCPTCGQRLRVYRPKMAERGPGAFYWCGRCEQQWDTSIRHNDPDADRIPDPVDVITGGSPCQDLSHAGKRAGMKTVTIPAGQMLCGCEWGDHTLECEEASPAGGVPARMTGAAALAAVADLNARDLADPSSRPGERRVASTRSGLWAAMCDAIDTIRPRLVVWENVRGALNAEADSAVEPCPICVGDRPGPTLRALGRVLGDLAELGYDAWWYGLRASDVGAAHGRFRVFVFATPADADVPRLEGRPGQPGDQLQERAAAERGGGAPELGMMPLLRTPTAQLAVNGGSQHPEKRKAGGHGPTLADEVEHLLPTPRASAGMAGPLRQHAKDDSRLEDAVATSLLPTPRATRGGSASETTAKLLPTPTAQAAKHGADDRGPGTLDDHNLWSVAGRLGAQADLGVDCEEEDFGHPKGGLYHLLPTPRATDGTKGGPNQRGSSGDLMLPSAVQTLAGPLLPTPQAADSDGGARCNTGGNPTLTGAAVGYRPADIERHGRDVQDWREYGAAISRQEQAFGREAPMPTEPGRNGVPRLSPAFVEWLMGLPAGHVTDPAIGISRNEQLKALGNGVCPQQAAAAALAFVQDMTKAVAS